MPWKQPKLVMSYCHLLGIFYQRLSSTVCVRHTCDLQSMQYVKKNVYEDGDVLNGNVAGFINSSIGREHIGNAIWEYVSLPTPWNPKTWGYIMTVATRDIEVGEELFTYYPLN